MSGAPTPEVRLSMPARAEGVSVVRQALSGVADALDFDEAVVADMKMAVTEACTNVVVHAYPGREGVMEVEARPVDRTLSVVVRDHGLGIVPRADSPGLGLGLPLIANLSDRLEIQGGPDGVGTQVEMAFTLKRAARPAER